MADSSDRKRQLSLVESFGALKKARISEAGSSGTSVTVEASFGDDVSDCSDTYSDGHANCDLGSDVLNNTVDLSECENNDLVGK